MKLQKWPRPSHFVHVHRAETEMWSDHMPSNSQWKNNNKKTNPLKKKSIPKGEERCSNCQGREKKKPKGTDCGFRQTPHLLQNDWIVWGSSHIWSTLPGWERFRRGKWHRDDTLVDNCGSKQTWEASQWLTAWFSTPAFHKNKESFQPLSVVEVNDGEYK